MTTACSSGNVMPLTHFIRVELYCDVLKLLEDSPIKNYLLQSRNIGFGSDSKCYDFIIGSRYTLLTSRTSARWLSRDPDYQNLKQKLILLDTKQRSKNEAHRSCQEEKSYGWDWISVWGTGSKRMQKKKLNKNNSKSVRSWSMPWREKWRERRSLYETLRASEEQLNNSECVWLYSAGEARRTCCAHLFVVERFHSWDCVSVFFLTALVTGWRSLGIKISVNYRL